MIHVSRQISRTMTLAMVAAIFAFAVVLAALPARAQNADKFTSNGDLVSGWYWLRDPAGNHYAEYTWATVPNTGDITLELTVLATDAVNGRSGVNAHFDLSVGYAGSGRMGGVFKKFGVTLQNTGGGSGLMSHGYYTLRRAAIAGVMPVSGQLFIRVERGSQRGPHVALRADSIKIVTQESGWDGLSDGYLMGDELLRQLLDDAIQGGGWWDDALLRDFLTELLRDTETLDRSLLLELLEQLLEGDGYDNADRLRDLLENLLRGGQLRNERLLRDLLDRLLRGRGTLPDERGGGTLPDERKRDDSVTDMHPDLGDHGDEGQCWLDRPCLGAAADGFRSTGFTGAEGWYWLRAPTGGQTADYLFETPPQGTALVLDIAVLGQNLVGATPKDTLHVNLTLGYAGSGSLGGQIGPVAVAIPRLWSNPDDDVWRGRALVAIPPEMAEAVIPAVGGLYLSFERIDAFEPDVGFSAGSVLLYPAQDIAR